MIIMKWLNAGMPFTSSHPTLRRVHNDRSYRFYFAGIPVTMNAYAALATLVETK
ncbi:hypothetical protein D3C77_439270 [compost metagenome]